MIGSAGKGTEAVSPGTHTLDLNDDGLDMGRLAFGRGGRIEAS